MIRVSLAAALALTGCDKAAHDSGQDHDSSHSGASDSHSAALIATVSDDYAVGALSTIGLDDWTITDDITDLSSDPALVAAGDWIFQLNRYGFDTVRVYAPGDWDEPVSEFALESGANPSDVAFCGDKYWISQYDVPSLVAYTAETGVLAGAIDLSSYADADGTPEAGSLAVAGGKLYVGLENLDTAGSWEPIDGAVLEVDCEADAIVNEWAPGVGAHVFDYSDGQVIVAVHGAYDGGEGGGLMLLDAAVGTLGPRIWTADDTSYVTDLEVSGDKAFALTSDANYETYAVCADLTAGTVTAAPWAARQFLTDVAVNDRGEAWVTARPHWAEPGSVGGVAVFDVATCADLTGGDQLATGLSPYAVSFY